MEPVKINVPTRYFDNEIEYVKAGVYLCPLRRRMCPVIVSKTGVLITFQEWDENPPCYIERISGNEAMGIRDSFYLTPPRHITKEWGTNRNEMIYTTTLVMNAMNGVAPTDYEIGPVDVVGFGWQTGPDPNEEVLSSSPWYVDALGKTCGHELPLNGKPIREELLFNLMLEVWGKNAWTDLRISLLAAMYSLKNLGKNLWFQPQRVAMNEERYYPSSQMPNYHR